VIKKEEGIRRKTGRQKSLFISETVATRLSSREEMTQENATNSRKRM
jgi:hypothetical protein